MDSYEQPRKYPTQVQASGEPDPSALAEAVEAAKAEAVEADAEAAEQPEFAETAAPERDAAGAVWMVQMDLRIFFRDRIYWITARVRPNITWATLLKELLQNLREIFGLKLPENVLGYTYYNMPRDAVLHPLDAIEEDHTGEILLIHKSEFVSAFDDRRRARLVAEMVRDQTTHTPPEPLEIVLTVGP